MGFLIYAATPTADFHAIDNLAHLARERIPERLVCIIHSYR
jgi:catalase